jgi:hypothetical protein
MNFLQIKQVSSNYLYIKNLFLFYFIGFSSFLDWAIITRKCRGSGARFPRLNLIPSWTAGWFSKTIRVLLQTVHPKGYGRISAVRLEI